MMDSETDEQFFCDHMLILYYDSFDGLNGYFYPGLDLNQ